MNFPLLKMNFKKCLILAVAMFAIAGCKEPAGAAEEIVTGGTWRYKIIVNVDTPEGLKSGYAVREMSNSRSKVELNLPQSIHPAKVKGEAVVVDLGKRGKLFALMSGYKYGPDHASTILYDVFPSESGGNSAAGIRFYRDLKEAHAVMTPEQYPMLVMFKDISDPKTVTPVMVIERDVSKGWTQVEYKIKSDNFEKIFGTGVKLKEIIIEMTEEPVTWGVREVRPSYGPETGFMDWFKGLPYGDPRKIMPSDFYKEGN